MQSGREYFAAALEEKRNEDWVFLDLCILKILDPRLHFPK
jgi:hypothetical protein